MFLNNLFLSFLLFAMFSSTNVMASVTLLGSRIIYPGTANLIDIQYKNDDDNPYVIQSWFDEGDIDSQPQKINNIPFIITPPVFRIQPKAGQVSRIIFNQQTKLPQDRETLFWFNMLQIPPTNQISSSPKNAMTVMLRNRVKFFYRPAAIGKPKNILDGLKVHSLHDAQRGNGIEIINDQPWHASIVAISLSVAGNNYYCEPKMILPFSRQVCWLRSSKKRLQGVSKVQIDAINDQGARISESYPINSQ